MAQAKAVSLSQFTAAVQSAVKAAVKKHPKFAVEAPESITFDHLIRGFPVPDTIFANASLVELQGFANEVAAAVSARPETAALAVTSGKGVFYSSGGHLIVGIPPADQFALKE